MSIASIDDDRVPGVHVPQNPRHTRDGRNAATAREDRGVTGLTARLRHNALDVNVAQRDHLRREQFISHDDQRALEWIHGAGTHHVGQMRGEPNHDVAHIVEPFAEILVLGAGKERRVLVQQPMERGLRRQAILGDPGADLLGKRRVPQNRLVNPEDRGFVVAHRRFHFGLQRAQVGRGALPSSFILRQLGRHLLVFEALSVRIYENLMDTVGDSDSDARGNGDSFSHAAQCSNRSAG